MNLSILKYSLVFVFLYGCQKPVPQMPTNRYGFSDKEESIQRSRAIYTKEKDEIQSFIEKENKEFKAQANGYWEYETPFKKENEKAAVSGDYIYYTYEVKTLDKKIIYDFETIGEQKILIGKQQLIRGLNESLKGMAENQEKLLLLPSFTAYGFHGDENKILSNTPLYIHLKVIKIIKQ